MMSRNLRFLLLAALAALVFFAIACGPPTSAESGGSGSEIVGNTGKDSTATAKQARTDAIAIAVPNAMIFLTADSLTALPDLATIRARSDSKGTFVISDAPLGTWYVSAFDLDGRRAVKKVAVLQRDTRYDIGFLNLF